MLWAASVKYWKSPFLTPRQTKAPQSINAKISKIDNVGETTWCAKFGKDRFDGSISPYG
jgi:hypothetical protein